MLWQSIRLAAQDISFFHLNTASGLSDNLVNSAVRDNNGLLWIGTAEGLNSYDGYSVKKFYKEEYPVMGSNHVLGMICDKKNRLWFRTLGGKVIMADEQRRFHPVVVTYKGQPAAPSFIRQTSSRGILLMSRNKLFVQKDTTLAFEQLSWEQDTVLLHPFDQIVNDGNDILIMTGNHRLCLFDVKQLKVIFDMRIPEIIGAARLNENELLVTTEKNRQFFRLRLSDKKVLENYGELPDQYGQHIQGYLRHIRKMADGRFILTSGYGGVYIFDPRKEELFSYAHDPLDTRSISANNTFYVHTDTSGYVFITTRSAGLNYFNVYSRLAAYHASFRQETPGKIFHGYINSITRQPGGHFWLGTQTGLIEWEHSTNRSVFHEYGFAAGMPMSGIEEVRTLCFDNRNKLWAGLNRYGIVVMNPQRKVIRYLNNDSFAQKGNHLPANFINRIVPGPDSKLWVATSGGICIIDPETFSVDRLQKHPVLSQLGKIYGYNIWFRNREEVWIATNRGAFRYRFSDQSLKQFDTNNGLTGNSVICFIEDKYQQVYIGTTSGIAVVKNETVVKTYTRGRGLRSDRCQGMMADTEGQIWIGNDNAILCYNPDDGSFRVFDESYGISPSGTRLLSFYQSDDGQQFWGSDAGLTHFYPASLSRLQFPLQLRMGSVLAGGVALNNDPGKILHLSYSKNNLQFSFSAVDLFSSRNIQYEYKLEGYDKDWKKANGPQEVSYNGLLPGNYSFHARISRDGLQWVEAKDQVRFRITTPWWRSVWFIGLTVLAGLGIIATSIRTRNRKITRQKEELETQQVINHFTSSIHEQKNEEDILWDITRNCIGRLGFEDCVIYLKDEDKNVLLQKAAWGPKTTEENKIVNPLEIPVGKGIVGSVAAAGKAEVVNDTSKDERYIVDDERRFSEISVPVVYNGRVIGVIDSEHSRKHFFTPRHLSILTTIASICANKIMRSRAEEARQKAQMELLEHQRKMAEAQLKSLRLQMSPHFLFNALNSIQQIILSGNDAAATRYLSKFSKLLRLVLQHSDREKISLKEETETLQLYLELESLRFDESFSFQIFTGSLTDTEEIKIPTLLIQPFVENALWHGLLHKEGKRQLTISFAEEQPDTLTCTVEDNGIGRKASGEISNTDAHTGKGLVVAAERIRTFNEQHTQKSYFTIEDITDEKGSAAGTRVILSLPLSKQ